MKIFNLKSIICPKNFIPKIENSIHAELKIFFVSRRFLILFASHQISLLLSHSKLVWTYFLFSVGSYSYKTFENFCDHFSCKRHLRLEESKERNDKK